MTGAPRWALDLASVNRVGQDPAKVVIAHLHPGEVSSSFAHSMQQTMLHDFSLHGRLMHEGRFGMIGTMQGAGRLERGRNDAVRMFLEEHTAADVLVFVDSDMGWDADGVERLVAVIDSDPTAYPIVGGLCFGMKPVSLGPQAAMEAEYFPTIYRWADAAPGRPPGFDSAYDYPADQLVRCSATGAAFIAIHRWALEKMRDAGGWFDTWHEPWEDTAGDEQLHPFGEDLSFCLRARSVGLPVHVHTGIRTSHHKSTWVNEDQFRAHRQPSASAVTVILPVKDQLHLTRGVVSDLMCQGGWTDLLIFDNGSTDPAMRSWLEEQDVGTVFPMPGEGITAMWTAGMAEATRRHGGLADLIFLNNDLRLGPQFCQRLIGGLRSAPGLMVASGNYDGRQGGRVTPAEGICAGRYDGTGGLAGFAFAVRAEWAARYRFPEGCRWFYGDTDLALTVDSTPGVWQGVVTSALVQHVGGGSQTPRPEGWDEMIEADRLAFLAKWPGVELVAA